MTAQLAHRRPDDERYLVRGSVGFGHRRVSLIDVDDSAQPMSSPDGLVHVCFNGEILNYQGLRRDTPYPYRPEGDTEVLSTFERHGIASVELRGFVCETLLSSDSFIASALDRATAAALLQRHLLGRTAEALRIWTLLSLEMWHRVFFTQSTRTSRHDANRMAESVRP